MKTNWLIFLFVLSACKEEPVIRESFPSRTEIISPEFSSSPNIFPIAFLNFSKKGITEKLPVVYVYFNDHAGTNSFLIFKDDINHFTLQPDGHGKYRPMFTPEALLVYDKARPYFVASQEQFELVKSRATADSFIEFPAVPEWLGEDETPLNEAGEKMQFICEVDLYDLVKDACRMFVFYDPHKKMVKNVYQRK